MRDSKGFRFDKQIGKMLSNPHLSLIRCFLVFNTHIQTDTLQLIRTPSYSLCKGLVLEWCVVDLDDTLVLLKEILPLGATAFLDAFNVEAQGPCNTHTHTRCRVKINSWR